MTLNLHSEKLICKIFNIFWKQNNNFSIVARRLGDAVLKRTVDLTPRVLATRRTLAADH